MSIKFFYSLFLCIAFICITSCTQKTVSLNNKIAVDANCEVNMSIIFDPPVPYSYQDEIFTESPIQNYN